MPEPESELSQEELAGLARLVGSGKITDEADLAEANKILASHGVKPEEPSVLGDVLGGAMTAIEKGVDTATFGLGSKLAEAVDPGYAGRAQQREEQFPKTAVGGAIGGYMMPGTGPARLGNVVGAGVRAIPGLAARMSPAALRASRPAASFGSRALTSVPVGAATGAATTAAEHAADVATGGEGEMDQMVDEVVTSALMGAAMGPTAEGLATAGGAMYHGLREVPKFMPWIRHVEAGGGGPAITHLRPPAGFRDVMSRAVQGRRTSAAEQAAEEAAPFVRKALGRREARVAQKHAAENQRYYDTPEGKAGASMDELVDEVMQSYAARKGAPFEPESATAQMMRDINKMVEIRVVPRGGPRPEGTSIYKLQGGSKEAKRLMGEESVELALASSTRALPAVAGQSGPGTPGSRPEFDFYLTPKRVDAKTLDIITSDLQSMIEKKFPDAQKFQRAAFKVRDKMAGNEAAPAPKDPIMLDDGTEIRAGWSALKRRQFEEQGQLESLKSSAGLRGNQAIKELREQTKRIAKALMSHGDQGTGMQADDIRMLLARNPAGAEAYRRFLGAKGFERIKQSTGLSVSGGLNPGTGTPYSFVRGAGDLFRMRMDPVAQQAMQLTPEAGGRAAAAMPIENLQQLMAIFAEQEDQ